MPDDRYPGRRQQPMQLDTRGHGLGILRHFNLTTLLVPVGATEDDVTNFMPDPSKGGVESTTKAVLAAIGTFFQMPVALGTKAGLQATE
eukprot:3137744-Amphidinium_carterae.1